MDQKTKMKRVIADLKHLKHCHIQEKEKEKVFCFELSINVSYIADEIP